MLTFFGNFNSVNISNLKAPVKRVLSLDRKGGFVVYLEIDDGPMSGEAGRWT